MWRGLAALVVVLSAPAFVAPRATQARVHAGPNQLEAGHRLAGSIAPLDGGGSFGSPAGAYSFRKLKSAYSGPAARVRRLSDSAELDINFLGFTGFTGAPWNDAAARAHCAATTCYVVTLYDQSGAGRHVTNNNWPQLIFDCIGTLPCTRTSAAGQGLLVSVTWASVVSSLSAVGKRQSGTGQCYFAGKELNNLASQNLVNKWFVTDFTSTAYDVPVTDAVWHAVVAVLGGGVAGVTRVDAAETVGPVQSGSSNAGNVKFNWGAASTVCDESEVILWDGYALSAGERAALTANQKNFWGTP